MHLTNPPFGAFTLPYESSDPIKSSTAISSPRKASINFLLYISGISCVGYVSHCVVLRVFILHRRSESRIRSCDCYCSGQREPLVSWIGAYILFYIIL